jgi:hypothetical protein
MSPTDAADFDRLPPATADSDEGAADDPGGWDRDDLDVDADDGGPEPFYPYDDGFDPADCSGTFDGFGVVSDADPGL